jgi:hypothetical protein
MMYVSAESVDETLPEIDTPESNDESCADSSAASADGAIPTTATMPATDAAAITNLRMRFSFVDGAAS